MIRRRRRNGAQFYKAINNFRRLRPRARSNVYRDIFPITDAALRAFHNSVLKALIGNGGRARKPYLPTLRRCLLRSRGFQFRGRRKKYRRRVRRPSVPEHLAAGGLISVRSGEIPAFRRKNPDKWENTERFLGNRRRESRNKSLRRIPGDRENRF